MAETLTVSQRDGTYWVGLALFLLGVILLLGGLRLSGFLIALGWGIIVLGTFVALFRILKSTVVAGVIGYREGQRNGR
jgi:hypothetical protein